MKIPLSGLFAGRVQPMPDDGRPTAIFKQPVPGRMQVGVEGLVGDAQADRRVHGGPEKALHHFPQETYAVLAEAFPEQRAAFVAGSIGENFSTTGLSEDTVYIGDVFAIGTARVQLAQPRTPCWKIDARFGADGITRFVAEHGIAGWYYRVVEPGEVGVGDGLELIDRHPDAPSLRAFWNLLREHRPKRESLLRLSATPGLTPAWRDKLVDRAGWLAKA